MTTSSGFFRSRLQQLASAPVNEATLTKRVDQYYVPVYEHLKTRLGAFRAKQAESNSTDISPFFVGVSAPQGCGKTTLVGLMQELFIEEGISCAVMSLDDFYLRKVDQDSLADRNPSNPMLQYRGNAGSHDLDLVGDVMAQLQAASTTGTNPSFSSSAAAAAVCPVKEVRIPHFDKALFGGRGDRADRESWPAVNTPVDVVIFEGWMLGFSAVSDDEAGDLEGTGYSPLNPPLFPSAVNMAGIADVNKLLAGPGYRNLHHAFDSWLVLQLDNVDHVYQWRLEAEKAQNNGLSDDDVRDFVARFMPSYRAYLEKLYTHGPQRRDDVGPQDVLAFPVGVDRCPIYDLSSRS